MAGMTIAVVGGGLTGLLAARTLGADSGSVIHIAPASPAEDKRTTAILMPGIRLLEELGLWEQLQPLSAPLRTMRLVDGSGRIVTAPTVTFPAGELGLDAFGYNVPNATLADALADSDSVKHIDGRVSGYENGALIVEGHKPVDADLIIACDGRQSRMRQIGGFGERRWTYPQTALVTTFAHSLPHGDVSTEIHTRTGPFTQVPLPPISDAAHRSSLVWSLKPHEARTIAEKPLAELNALIEKRLDSSLGAVTVETPPQAFPIEGLIARTFASGKILLVGEAGHVFPPIGAQGFNLGVSDILALRGLVQDGRGAMDIASTYVRMRRAETSLRTAAVDTLNRSLLSGFLPIHAARAFTLGALGSFSHLRQLAMRAGLGGATAPERDRREEGRM